MKKMLSFKNIFGLLLAIAALFGIDTSYMTKAEVEKVIKEAQNQSLESRNVKEIPGMVCICDIAAQYGAKWGAANDYSDIYTEFVFDAKLPINYKQVDLEKAAPPRNANYTLIKYVVRRGLCTVPPVKN